MKFTPHDPDYTLSPYTGMTRKHWLDAAKYLLEGVFKNISDYSSPVVLPRTETDVTYPHKDAAGNRLKMEQMAQIFEGLTRTLFIAAPLICNDENTEICGFDLRKYYSEQILRSCTKGDPCFVGYYEDLQQLSGVHDDFITFQQTVETCALVIGLDITKRQIWDRYEQADKDKIADFLLSYAHKGTCPQNWRFFNLLSMAFLHKEGYKIDKDVMTEHASALLAYYSGDGWYRDGQSFDYYSCWAFNLYAPIWNRWYGYKNLPYIAKRFEENSNKLMENYPDFFDRDGFTTMWGRSCVYRCAAASPLPENLLLQNPKVNAGLARRIASGTLLQFLSREDFLKDGVPTMGFYRQFRPLIQGYSCTESAYWLGKVFLCLALPEESPFWTEKENNGSWETLSEKGIKETVLNAPALCYTNHNANGENILRTGKVIKQSDDIHGMWNYSKISYNSKYPWEASPSGTVESMQYVLTYGDDTPHRCNATFWCGSKNGVLYRRQFFDYNLNCEMHWHQAITLSDFPVPCGMIRADRLKLYRTPISLTLGSYGFPDNGSTEIIKKTSGKAKAIILKGYDSTGSEKQLAMTIYDGWDELSILHSEGTNPDSEMSLVIYAKTARSKQYGNEPAVLISQTITKESHEDFDADELFPISQIVYTDPDCTGCYGSVTIKLKNGEERVIDFYGTEGNMTL